MSHDQDHERRSQEADAAVLRAYESMRSDGPPPHIDAAVKARARQALRSRRAAPRWWIPASLAATVLLAFTIVVQVEWQSGHEAARGDAATSAEATSAELAVKSIAEEGPAAAGPPARIAPPTPVPPADREPAGAALAPTEGTAASPQPVTAAEASLERRAAPAPMSAASTPEADLPTPEDWLRRIEELEARSLHEEAAAERARLEQAYPGWLERHARSPQ